MAFIPEETKPNAPYTNKEAVMDALRQWEPGTDKHGYDLARMTYRNLRAHGSSARPMDATILRYLRYYGNLYGVSLKDRSKSLYHKRGIHECPSEALKTDDTGVFQRKAEI